VRDTLFEPLPVPNTFVLLAAKSSGWASIKKDYDMLPSETVSFLKPLCNSLDVEIQAVEKS